MKKTIFVLVVLLASLFAMRIRLGLSQEVTIQNLIDKASWGDTVYLPSGIYYENVWVNKSLTVIGNSTTIIGDSEWGTIGVWCTKNVTLKNLLIKDSFDGIYIGASKHCTVENCVFLNLSGVAVEFESSEYCIARNVTVQTSFDGFYLDLSHHCTIENCTIQNTTYAMPMSDARNQTIKNNVFRNNMCGTDFYGVGNTFIGNRFENNDNGIFVCGDTIFKSANNTFQDNILINNNIGIHIFYHVHNNTFYRNTLINSTTANMQITYYSRSNLIYCNNFFKGTGEQVIFHGTVYENYWNKSTLGNYWSDYNGTDLLGGVHQNETGSDGIGDSPYEMAENNVDYYPLMEDPPMVPARLPEWRNKSIFTLPY